MSRKSDGGPAGAAAWHVQDGAGSSQTHRAQRHPEAKQQGGKLPKAAKGSAKGPYKDMLYYSQKLGGSSISHNDAPSGPSDIAMAEAEDQAELDDTAPLQFSPVSTPDISAIAGSDTPQPTLSDILQAVHHCTASVVDLKRQFGGLQETVSLLRHDIQKIRERTTAVEGRVSDLEDQLPSLTSDSRSALQQVTMAASKADDLENRLRRNNVRVVGLPEKLEGRDPTEFMEAWLQEVFGKEAFTALYAVERAHRVPPRPLPPGSPPRSMLIRLLNYRDREIILRLAREKGPIRHNGARISFYPDFSVEVQRRRAKYQDVKRRLQHLQLKYAMLYPARLRVIAEDQAHFFDTAPAAAAWLDQHESALRRRSPNRMED